jgi:hypothetical protein
MLVAVYSAQALLHPLAPRRVAGGMRDDVVGTFPGHFNCHFQSARQIRSPNLSNSLAEPLQFQPQKNLEDFESGQLFSSNPRA